MPNKHPLRKYAKEGGGEYVLGAKDLHTHACYLIYGELGPGEGNRKVRPGKGHEEILMAVAGALDITGEPFSGLLAEGEAIHLREDETCFVSNSGESRAVYVLAGGHSGKEH